MEIIPKIIVTPNTLYGKINSIEIDYHTPKDMLIGTFISRTLSLKIANIDGDIPSEIKLKIGMNDEEPISQPTFIVTKHPKNEDTGEIEIKGSDYSFKLEDYFSLELVYPLTLKELVQAISKHTGVDVENLDFINSMFVMEKPKIDERYTYREIIGMVASAMGGIAYINNDDKIEFKVLTETEFEVDNIFENIINGEKVGPINSVVLAREPIIDNIQLKNDESIKQYGKTEIKIINNYLLDDNRESAIKGIYNNLLGKEFYCYNITTYQGYKLNPFDIVKVGNKKVLINNINFKFPLILDGFIGSEQLTKTEIEHKTAKGLEKSIINAEANVNKLEGKITLLTQESNEHEEKLSQQQIEIDSIKAEVANTVEYKREINEITEIKIEDAGKAEILKFEVQGNKTYEANLFPNVNLYPYSTLQPNQRGG